MAGVRFRDDVEQFALGQDESAAGAVLGNRSLATSKSVTTTAHDRAAAAVPLIPRQGSFHQSSWDKYKSLDDFSNPVEIYKGRHSVVWSAVSRHDRQAIIIKGYMKAKMSERNYVQVAREIALMKGTKFSGCVKLLGTFEDPDAFYLVLESCPKGDLFKKLIRNGGTLTEKYVVAEVVLPLLLTLEHLHLNNIVHRDIKPENIFFSRTGALRLGDFGLAIQQKEETPTSRVGTLDYMAPEVVSLTTDEERKKLEQLGKLHMIPPYASSKYDEKVDVWAVGVLAYELLVGRPPFEVEDEKETAMKIMFDSELENAHLLSKDALDFVKLLLIKDPKDRPSANQCLSHAWVAPHYKIAQQQMRAAQEYAQLGGSGRTLTRTTTGNERKATRYSRQGSSIRAEGDSNAPEDPKSPAPAASMAHRSKSFAARPGATSTDISRQMQALVLAGEGGKEAQTQAPHKPLSTGVKNRIKEYFVSRQK